MTASKFFVEGQAAGLRAIPTSVAVLTRKVFTLMVMKTLAVSIVILLSLAAASIGISSFIRVPQVELPEANAQAAPKAGDEGKNSVRPESVLEDALLAAEQIPVLASKVRALIDIAVAQASLGQKEPSRETYRRVTQIIDEITDRPELKAGILAILAEAQAKAGDLDAARATVVQSLEWSRKIENEQRRRASLQMHAVQQAMAGDVPGALTFFHAMNDAPAWVRAFALSEISGEQAREGDLPGARATMTSAIAEAERAEHEARELEAHPERVDKGPPGHEEESPSDSYAMQVVNSRLGLEAMRLAQVRGLTPLAEAEVKAGQIDAAHAWLKQARAITNDLDEDWRPEPLAQIAMAQAKVGDQKAAQATLALAVKTAEVRVNTNRRAEMLARVAREQIDGDDRAGARKTLKLAVRHAETPQGKNIFAQSLLAKGLSRAGDWEKGRQFALGLSSEFLRANAVQSVAFEQAKAGELREALEWAEDQSDALLRSQALLGIVRGIIEHATPPSTN